MDVFEDDIKKFGFIHATLFRRKYGSQTTIEQMVEDAENEGWIRAILPNLENHKEIEAITDWSEVGV